MKAAKAALSANIEQLKNQLQYSETQIDNIEKANKDLQTKITELEGDLATLEKDYNDED